MQLMITHGRLAKTKIIQLSIWRLVGLAVVGLSALIVSVAVGYHLLFMTAAREGWPVAGTMVRSLFQEQLAQRDRYVRENLDAMAQKVGELQARLLQLEAVSDRVSGLAGLKPDEVRPPRDAVTTSSAGRGGPLIPLTPTIRDIHAAVTSLVDETSQRSDVFALVESRLFEKRLRAAMVPSSAPVDGGTSSGFGIRGDPFTGRAAFHSGLDFPAPIGTPIVAAAGGFVVAVEIHPAYGTMVMVDHGNGLVTRYAHLSKTSTKLGELVKRGQKIAEVGSSGRSTGPHLHFEVLVDGVPQDPARFLAGNMAGDDPPAGSSRVAARGAGRR